MSSRVKKLLIWTWPLGWLTLSCQTRGFSLSEQMITKVNPKWSMCTRRWEGSINWTLEKISWASYFSTVKLDILLSAYAEYEHNLRKKGTIIIIKLIKKKEAQWVTSMQSAFTQFTSDKYFIYSSKFLTFHFFWSFPTTKLLVTRYNLRSRI